MNRRVFNFELDGKTVLGFDTGLSAQAFAQSKMAAFITNPGFIVYPGGKVDTWYPGGVSQCARFYADTSEANTPGRISGDRGAAGNDEKNEPAGETMIVWGPSFPGEELAEIISAADRKDEALNALRFWLRAKTIMEENPPDKKDPLFPGPAGAFIVSGEARGQYPAGTVFFPPARLLKRSLDAAGSEALEAERWVHPDLRGAEAVSFSAGTMLYRIFSGSPPFLRDNDDELRQDIREAVFVPPNLAAPGIDPEMCGIITRAMSRVPQNKEVSQRPAPDAVYDFIGPPSSKPVSSWIKSLTGEELSKIHTEYENYNKKTAITVKTRRFVIRNTAILMGALIAVVALVFFIRGYIRHQAELPTTKGMAPLEVVETYYGAFGTLDHMLMEACVTGKAGKRDIEMVVNFFVISRMRQAYESTLSSSISAQEWIDRGRPLTSQTIFGITDMKMTILAEGETEMNLEADYTLWMPASYLGNEETLPAEEGPAEGNTEIAPLPPESIAVKDNLVITFEKDSWHITALDRKSGVPNL